MPFFIKLFKISHRVKNVAILLGLITLVEGILWYFLPIYFEMELKDLFLVSIAIAAHPIASLFAGLPSGDLTDKIGRKFIFILGSGGFILSFLFLFAGNFLGFVVFMALYGIFSTMYDIGAYVSILDYSEKRRTGESVGFFASLHSSGWFFGSILGGILLTFLPIPLLLKILFIFLIIIVFLSMVYFPGRISVREFSDAKNILQKDGLYAKEFKSVMKLGRLPIVILMFYFAIGFWDYAIWTFEPIYTTSIGSGFILGALLLGLYCVPGIIAALVGGKFIDKFGGKKIMILAFFLLIIGQSIFLFQQDLLFLSLSLILTATAASLIALNLDCIVKFHVARNLRGELDGATETFYNIGGIIGPLTIGFLLSLADLVNLYYFTFALFIVSIVLFSKIWDLIPS